MIPIQPLTYRFEPLRRYTRACHIQTMQGLHLFQHLPEWQHTLSPQLVAV
jgi:hypothetical protein